MKGGAHVLILYFQRVTKAGEADDWSCRRGMFQIDPRRTGLIQTCLASPRRLWGCPHWTQSTGRGEVGVTVFSCKRRLRMCEIVQAKPYTARTIMMGSIGKRYRN